MQQLPTSLDTWAAHTVTRTHMRACILAAQLLDDPYSLNAESPSGFCTAGWFRNISPGDTLSHAARYASTMSMCPSRSRRGSHLPQHVIFPRRPSQDPSSSSQHVLSSGYGATGITLGHAARYATTRVRSPTCPSRAPWEALTHAKERSTGLSLCSRCTLPRGRGHRGAPTVVRRRLHTNHCAGL